jgi:hypothetical protein
LKRAYAENFGRCGDHLTHSKQSRALFASGLRGRLATLQHSWNHSLWKLAALQSKHGWKRFLVVFDRNLTGHDADRYCAAGLVFCTTMTLTLTAKNYSVTVTPEAGSKAPSPVDVEFIDCGRFLAAVAADEKAVAKRKAADSADLAAGRLPF